MNKSDDSRAFIYELIALKLTKPAYRLVTGVVIAGLVIVVWVELATGALSRMVG